MLSRILRNHDKFPIQFVVTESPCPAVAHVWDADKKKWWRCDDETVTEMPKGPVAERGDHGVAAEKKVRLSIPCVDTVSLPAHLPEEPEPPARL